MTREITEQEPVSPLVIDHGDTRTVDQGQQPEPEGRSELEQFKIDRGYTKAPAVDVKKGEPFASAEITDATVPIDVKKAEDKKPERFQDPDTGDQYDMRHRVSRRIKTLLEERGKTKAEADTLRQEVSRLTQLLIERGNTPAQAEQKAEAIVADAEPDPGDLQKYPEGQFDRGFIRDQARWAARQETKTQFDHVSTQAREHQREAAFNQTVDKWNQTLPDARKKYADFDQVLSSFARTPENEPVTEVMFTSPVGNDVVYILGTNESAKRAYNMARSDRDRYRVLYHIEAQIIQMQRSAAQKIETATTNAPSPTEPVNTAAGAAQGIDWSKDDPDAYQRWKSQRGNRR